MNELEIYRHVQKLDLKYQMKLISMPFNTIGFMVLIIVLYIYKIVDNKEINILVISAIYSIILKLIFKRKRPYQTSNIVLNHSDKYHNTLFNKYSFPSGHTLVSTVLSLIMLDKYPTEFFYNLIPILVGFSRIFLGVHYPSDILGGIFFGYTFYQIIK